MLLNKAKQIINEKHSNVLKFRVHFKKTVDQTLDYFPASGESGLKLQQAKKMARDFYHANHGRFINIEVKRDND